MIPPHVDEFVKREGMPAARRLPSDLGLKAVSSGGARGGADGIGRGSDGLSCGATGKFTQDDYKRGVDNAREVGEIVRPDGVVAMLEFTRGSTFIGTLRHLHAAILTPRSRRRAGLEPNGAAHPSADLQPPQAASIRGGGERLTSFVVH